MKNNLIKSLSRKTLERILKNYKQDYKGSRKELESRVSCLTYSEIKEQLN
jgi:hypothetical protein